MSRDESPYLLSGELPLWILWNRAYPHNDPRRIVGHIKRSDAGFVARHGEDFPIEIGTFETLAKAQTALEIYI